MGVKILGFFYQPSYSYVTMRLIVLFYLLSPCLLGA